MKDIATLPVDEAKRLSALLFDLDDTLLDHGRLGEAAYSALFRLAEAGFALVAVTGRPSGWGEVIARQWPVQGVVAENGAIACALVDERLTVLDFAGTERARRREQLDAIVRDVQARFPALRPADDVIARRSDFTFDIGEHERVAREQVEEVRAYARSRGARTVASSVHLHLTLDGYDKASGAVRFLRESLGWDPTESAWRAAFIGDSENDEACFNAFRTTIAVANFTGRPTRSPRYVTRAQRGTGFAEAARTLIDRHGC
jgi:HAD superfamily hydrolase (TIGR01484 family)